MTAILAYHKVDDRFELGLTNVKPKTFVRQIQRCIAEGYRIVSGIEPGGSGKSVCLTFDDGYDCFHRNVVPALEAAGGKAVVFVIADYIGKTNNWDVRLSYKRFKHMSVEQIREVAEMGYEVGSHSCTHKDLTRLTDGVLKEELIRSKKLLEDITGIEVEALSFPFGRYNMSTAEAAFEAGYRRLFGMGSSANEGVIPRIPVYRIDTPGSVLRKVELDKREILKSDFIHSFANISALLSVRESRVNRHRTPGEG